MKPLMLLRRLRDRVGRRGASLLFVGVLSLVLTASILTAGPAQLSSPTYAVLSALAPLPVWAAGWGLSVLVCWVQAFMAMDRIAFAVSTAMWWAYGIAYLVGSVSGANPRGWVLGLVWIGFGGWLNLIATWPESADFRPGGRRHARRN